MSAGNKAIFCFADVPDYRNLLKTFNCGNTDKRGFKLGSYEVWRSSTKWPLVGVLSVETTAPRRKGNDGAIDDQRFRDALSAMKGLFRSTEYNQR